MTKKKGLLALSPLAVFLCVYLVTSLVSGDFYKVPVSAAFLVACIYGFCISGGTLSERISSFSDGAGNRNVLLMVWIFILAGAFAGTAKDMGAVEATVNLAVKIIPSKMIVAGLFLTSCFISLSIGTSVGTIVALAPIAGGVASQVGVPVPYMAGVVVGGALFGDNLSFISDTTIASTRAMGCEMKDKFRVNIHIVAPALLVAVLIYILQGSGIQRSIPVEGSVQLYKLIPYLLVIALALAGLNVTVILAGGIVANAIIGFACSSFTWVSWLQSVGAGIDGMTELIAITLLAGGMLEMIRSGGGIDFLIDVISSRAKGRRGSQFGIAALVGIADLCTANNTIAIIMTGGISREISDRAGLDPRKTASILDTFACIVQGVIPYGAQVMMAAGLCGCAPTAVLPHLYYPYLTGVAAVLSIILRYPRKYS